MLRASFAALLGLDGSHLLASGTGILADHGCRRVPGDCSNQFVAASGLRQFPVSLCVAFTLKERDPSDYDYDPDRDGIVPMVPSPQPVSPVVRPIHAWNAFAVNAGGRPGIRMIWSPQINARAVSWEIRLASDGTVVNSGTTSDLARGQTTQTAGLKPSTTYTVIGQLVLPGRVTEAVTTIVTTQALGLTDSDFVGGISKLFRDQGMYAIEYMANLPAMGAFIGQLVFNTTTGKLHRWTGTAWVEVVQGALQGVLDETNFAQGISVPRVVSALPTTGNYAGRLVVLSTDGRLYRWTAGAWTAEVAADQVVGKLTAAQIAAGAIGVDQLAAGAVVASKMAITDFTNLVPDDQMQDAASWTINATGNVTHFPTHSSASIQSRGLFRVDAAGANVTQIVGKPSAAKPGMSSSFRGRSSQRGMLTRVSACNSSTRTAAA